MTYINDKKNKEKTDYRSLIKKQAFRLAELLAQSPEYQQFVNARNKLAADDEQNSLFSDLRQQQISLRMVAMMGEESRDELEDFENLYAALSGSPVISEYLFAEGRLFHLIADVEEVFSDKLELWQLPDADNYDYNSLLN
jgi:cell fate (sporulation/competence/biofilm development) regulator YlbF (YheA/YmcA/DUF963 family)